MQRTINATEAREEREDWRELVRRAREQVRADLGERDLTPPEDVLREVRKESDQTHDPSRSLNR